MRGGLHTTGGLFGGFFEAANPLKGGGVFGDIEKIRAFIQFLVQLPVQIVAFLQKLSWTTDVFKLVKAFFDPSFDLYGALLAYSSVIIKLTLIAVILFWLGGWGFFFLALFSVATFTSMIPAFWGSLFLLGFEIVGSAILRAVRGRKRT